MLVRIIKFSLENKLIIILASLTILGFGLFSLTQIPIGAVPDITNNQVQVITTSRNLSTQDIEQYITYPVELEMANLPGVKEIRSISKFGLSVVTIVFEENLGTYLPRQLIAEKIKSAAEKIPEGFGTPEMGPISTGLGEIYQYILDTKPGYDSVYSPMELRTIQDWVVRRQLSGIKGVVEINTWGGFLKQYEVSVDPNILHSTNITIVEIFNALEKNNGIVGGGYIEKSNMSYFIRGEGAIKSIRDIESIVVKNINGTPVLIRDVASVIEGPATRFGAITANGQGEKVLGQVMMLKDANSKEVIEAVKKRVAEVQKTLPEGIYINAFLERSELLERTTHTIIENLVLGCLIVIFVVVLLLGNFRSGLVVASVIPLSLMFALTMMHIFGIDANLMSLGAIDFGIIIDGAVIIVEFIAFQINTQSKELHGLNSKDKQTKIDKITYTSTSKMMTSAVFGQLIILIVFIPILSLTNIEGKMFIPMALTVSFALIGAMILCFTYVPVASSMFLKPVKIRKKKTISEHLMNFIERSYTPSIKWALNHRKAVIILAFSVLSISIFIFSRMGGEFVPTLDEGDFVIQPVLKTGTSLGKTIETTTKIETILLENFPEVDQVVSRIGAAEVPTDPMSMEESDVIIRLKPKKDWVSAKSKDELADLFKEALSVIPGMEIEFTQPIEMRFNELITGVRADVAIKIYGEDLNVLYKKGLEIKELISHVEGASDITVDKITGLPQMSVKYDRSKIARYGLSVDDVNKLISMQFAGLTAGNVFEGEKRFDLVVKLDEKYRKDLRDLQKLYIQLDNGTRVPLTELAEVEHTTGPAKIARDETKRRMVVGVNVRNRDLESVVQDIQLLINENLKLPAGYYISYGGQFENLRNAKKRLLFAVPIALFLIFIMLHFAFKSFMEALMVYTAIPLSAVGGILLLWIRQMPFSISAGVGFIALFGIAVLNGIVLIEYLKELKAEGVTDVKERVLKGTHQRLRPVLLTASAAALGFLPMAISTSAGAEVQRPLATVVIGGLITSTLLTMIVLPIFYYLLETKNFKFKGKSSTKKMLSLVFLIGFFAAGSYAQNNTKSLEQLIDLAMQNNPDIRAEELKVQQSKALMGTAFDLEKTSIYYNYDENNVAANDLPLKVWGINQSLNFPTVYFSQRQIFQTQYQISKSTLEMEKMRLTKEVSQAFDNIQFLQNKLKAYSLLDSLYQKILQAADRKYELGETNRLETLNARVSANQNRLESQEVKKDLANASMLLEKLVQSENSVSIELNEYTELVLKDTATMNSYYFDYLSEIEKLSAKRLNYERQQLLPDLQFEYFRGSNNGLDALIYPGYEFGVSIPIWFGAQASRIRAAKIEKDISQTEILSKKTALKTKHKQLQTELDYLQKNLATYKTENKALIEELFKSANKSYESGLIDFFQFVQSIQNASQLQMKYLESLNQYNQLVLELNYLTY